MTHTWRWLAQGLMRARSPDRRWRLPVPGATDPLVHRSDLIAVSGEDVVAGAPPIRELLSEGQTLLVTHGGDGALRISPHSGRIVGYHMPPFPKRVAIDSTGAGDTFLATYVAIRR
jgi:sugar/nucleoside kinase (ribokinase family)